MWPWESSWRGWPSWRPAPPRKSHWIFFEAGPDSHVDLTLKFDEAKVPAALGDVHTGQGIEVRIAGTLVDGSPKHADRDLETTTFLSISTKGGRQDKRSRRSVIPLPSASSVA